MSASTHRSYRKPVALVVEGDAPLCRLTLTILRQQGYEVLESRTDELARSIILQTAELDLLVVGISLPGGANGVQLAKFAWSKNPAMRIIVTGATSPSTEELVEVESAGMTFLSLPYSFGRLSQVATTAPAWTTLTAA